VLARKFRLNSEREFKKIFSRGRYISGNFITIKYYFHNALENPKIGVVVSKKISNKATVRNKLKRQINEVIYSVVDKIGKSLEIVIIVKKIADDFTLLREDIINSLRKGKMI